MKSITLHNIDDTTTALIEQKSREWGLSLNKTIQRLLRESLGVSTENQPKPNDFSEFLGLWSDAELAEFQSNTKDFDKIDEENWK